MKEEEKLESPEDAFIIFASVASAHFSNQCRHPAPNGLGIDSMAMRRRAPNRWVSQLISSSRIGAPARTKSLWLLPTVFSIAIQQHSVLWDTLFLIRSNSRLTKILVYRVVYEVYGELERGLCMSDDRPD